MKSDIEQQLDNIQLKIEFLARKQHSVLHEIEDLRKDLKSLKQQSHNVDFKASELQTESTFRMEDDEESVIEERISTPNLSILGQLSERVKASYATPKGATKIFDWEKFIGENLANKIGIAITIIGVAIGVKYSIEHQLLSPMLRVAMGYLFAIVMLAVGLGLKKKLTSFSAVLVSGAMAIMYFMTYAGFSFYGLFSQPVAFALMLVFTVLTVFFAIRYNLQVIAHIALVGAYAVPLLLSTGSGKIEILFSYMTIINVGILALAVVKYWKPLYYVSFALSWLMMLLWFDDAYKYAEHFNIVLLFSAVFFVLFYAIALIYKLARKEKFDLGDVIIILSNSFIYYAIGYQLLSSNAATQEWAGLFTLCNALVHAAVSFTIYRQKLADRNLMFLIIGLVLVFVTLTIPVQLDGYRVTVLWAVEALALFWIGRTRQVAFYERLAYPLMVLSLVSIFQDWFFTVDNVVSLKNFVAILNVDFLSALLVIVAFVSINIVQYKNQIGRNLFKTNLLNNVTRWMAPSFLIIIIYFSFRMEIDNYWSRLYNLSEVKHYEPDSDYTYSTFNYSIGQLKRIWIINYSLLFFSVLSLLNMYWLKIKELQKTNLILNVVVILSYLTVGLLMCSSLRDSFINGNDNYAVNEWNIYIRYVSYVFALPLIVITKIYAGRTLILDSQIKKLRFFQLFFHLSLLWVASSELISILHLHGYAENYKIGLSILWGVYALLLVVLGMWQKQSYLRWASIVLFGFTLVKLMLYDLAHMNSISKTIIMVSLGLLLLLISFLYNKYRKYIFGSHEEE